MSHWSGRRGNYFWVSFAKYGRAWNVQGMRDVRKGVALFLVGEPILKLVDLGTFKAPGILRRRRRPDVGASTRRLLEFWVAILLIRVFDCVCWGADSLAFTRVRRCFYITVAVVSDLYEELGSCRHLRIQVGLPCDMQGQVIRLGAIVYARRSVHGRLQKHVIHLCAEVDPSETDEKASCHPCDPSVLEDVA